MPKSKQGIITFTEDRFNGDTTEILKFMMKINFLPFNHRKVYETGAIEYAGTCPLFVEVEEDHHYPRYDMDELLKQKEQDNAK